jgi:hypothetical protein
MSDKRTIIDLAGAWLRPQESSSSGAIDHQSALKPAVSAALAQFVKGFALVLAVITGVSMAPRPAAADDDAVRPFSVSASPICSLPPA